MYNEIINCFVWVDTVCVGYERSVAVGWDTMELPRTHDSQLSKHSASFIMFNVSPILMLLSNKKMDPFLSTAWLCCTRYNMMCVYYYTISFFSQPYCRQFY